MMDGTTFNTRVTAEANGRGYDAATIRKVVAERKKDPAKREEAQAVFELYWEAL